MDACILRWEQKLQTQSGTQLAAHSSNQSLQYMSEDATWNREWICVKVRLVLHPTSTKCWRKIYVWKVTHRMTEAHMWQCMETNNLYPSHYECEGKAFLDWILTAYETWACSHEHELKKVKWMASPNMATKMSKETGYAVSHVQWDLQSWGCSSTQALPLGTTVALFTRDISWNITYIPHCIIWRPRLPRSGSDAVHSNAHCHVANTVTDLFKTWNWDLKEAPLYPTDMNLCHYSVFQTVQQPLHSICFWMRDNTVSAESVW